jgi:hypothetical protein
MDKNGNIAPAPVGIVTVTLLALVALSANVFGADEHQQHYIVTDSGYIVGIDADTTGTVVLENGTTDTYHAINIHPVYKYPAPTTGTASLVMEAMGLLKHLDGRKAALNRSLRGHSARVIAALWNPRVDGSEAERLARRCVSKIEMIIAVQRFLAMQPTAVIDATTSGGLTWMPGQEGVE